MWVGGKQEQGFEFQISLSLVIDYESRLQRIRCIRYYYIQNLDGFWRIWYLNFQYIREYYPFLSKAWSSKSDKNE